MIEVAITNYRRPKNIEKIIENLRNQTMVPFITIINAGYEHDFKADRIIKINNLGPINRYLVHRYYNSKYTLLLDDDFLSGSDFVRHMFESAEKLNEFGVLGQYGRIFQNEYNFRDAKSKSGFREVNALVRGYCIRTSNMHGVISFMLKNKIAIRDSDDDLIMAAYMNINGLKNYVVDGSGDTEMIVSNLPMNNSFSSRPNHKTKRTAYANMLADLGWNRAIQS